MHRVPLLSEEVAQARSKRCMPLIPAIPTAFHLFEYTIVMGDLFPPYVKKEKG